MGRHIAYVVVLDEPLHEDDSADVIAAIRMLRHVSSVEVVEPSSANQVARIQVRNELSKKLWKVLYPEVNNG